MHGLSGPPFTNAGFRGQRRNLFLQKSEAGGRRAEIRGQKPKERTLFLNFISFLPIFQCSRKNICEPEMGLMMTFCPPMTMGAVELVCQATGGTRLVADSTV